MRQSALWRLADLIERREWLPDNILALVAEHLRGNGTGSPFTGASSALRLATDVSDRTGYDKGTDRTNKT